MTDLLINMENTEIFKENGYVLVKNVLSKELIEVATRYTLFDEEQNLNLELSTPDREPQIHNSHSKYADPLMESLLIQLQHIIEINSGLKLYPTYSYYRVYRPGAILKIHKDRPSCEISATLSLGFDYKNDSLYKWPIYMDGTPCVLEPGDLVIYRGCDLDHWREKFTAPEDSFHSQVFLHYVDAQGPYNDFKFDERPYVGFKPKKEGQQTNQIVRKSYITYTD